MKREDDILDVALFLAQEHGCCANAVAARIGELQFRRQNDQGVAFWADVEDRINSLLLSSSPINPDQTRRL